MVQKDVNNQANTCIILAQTYVLSHIPNNRRTCEQESDVSDADGVEKQSDFQNVIGAGEREKKNRAGHRH